MHQLVHPKQLKQDKIKEYREDHPISPSAV